MSKSIKIFSIILIIFSLFISFYGVYATTDIDMNLETNDGNDVTLTDEDSYIPPSSVGATVEEGLSFSNILNILLITVGVVLILLAIAIIIRLK